jgi:hypothetical protein
MVVVVVVVVVVVGSSNSSSSSSSSNISVFGTKTVSLNHILYWYVINY